MKRLMMSAVISFALISASTASAAERRGRGQPVSEQEVGRIQDHDRVNVGPFRQLRIEVRGAPIEIREVVVTLGDGKKFRPRIPKRLEQGSDYVIDLPGRRGQSVDGVEFVYTSIDPRQQPAKVILYAR